MDLDKTLVFIEQIFSHFGWYSLALVALTTFVMIPVSLLLKKIFKSESTQKRNRTARFKEKRTLCGNIRVYESDFYI